MKISGVKEEKKSVRELRENTDQITDENIYPHEYDSIKDNEARVESNARKESTCGRCHVGFDSRNELFKHLEQEDHKVISEGDEDERINTVTNKRGRRKFSRGDRKHKQLLTHRQVNFEDIDNIGGWLESHG